MATPPYFPPLHIVLQALKDDFELTNEQLAALPPLDEVDLAPHSDSRLIEHAEPGVFTYHPYKLFIGKHGDDFFHAYLQRKGGRKQYQIELCSVDTKNDTHYAPISSIYYGTVNNLAYPFNMFLGSNRFTAVVKWYFLLAFRAGEFDEDPGFLVTASWTKELQGACNDLIAAPSIEADKKLKDQKRKGAEMKRAFGRETRKSQDTIQQTTDYQKTDTMLLRPRAQADGRPQQTSTRKDSATMTEHENGKDIRGHRGHGQRASEGAATKKSNVKKQGIILTEERPTQRRKIENAAKDNGGRALDGTADNRIEQEDATKTSWTQEVKRLTSVKEDELTQDDRRGEASGPVANEAALRGAEWMRLFRQKMETARQMRNLENEMTVKERLEVFDKVKHA